MLSGKRLTAIASALMLLAAAAAVRLAVSGNPGAPPFASASAAGGGSAGPSIDAHLSSALTAEKSGDITTALSHYRAAASLDPLCVDRNSSRFLGAQFEEKIRRWAADLRGGRMQAGPAAVRDASYLFRRMYGGCG